MNKEIKEEQVENINVVDALSKRFVYMTNTLKALEVAFTTNTNIVLFGKGGHGKSDLTEEFFKFYGIEPYVFTMGSGTSTDRLFGGTDIKKFTEEGVIEYLVENSFMNHEYVVFEELFDAPDFILEQLKDILSSGRFRYGSQTFEVKTKCIICCTNKTRDEFSKTTSLKALMERFPLQFEVKWQDYNAVTYKKLFDTVFGEGHTNPLLLQILDEFAKEKHEISPRIAIKAAELIRICGEECLLFLADFQAKGDILKKAIDKAKAMTEVNKLIAQIEDINKKVKVDNLKEADEIKAAGEENEKMAVLIKQLKDIKKTDEIITYLKEKENSFTKIYESNKKVLQILKDTDTLASLSEEF